MSRRLYANTIIILGFLMVAQSAWSGDWRYRISTPPLLIPTYPKDYRECSTFYQEQSAILRDLEREHEDCLSVNRGGRESGRTCSHRQCQHLHDIRDRFREELSDANRICGERVQLTQQRLAEERRREQEVVKERQKQEQLRIEAIRKREREKRALAERREAERRAEEKRREDARLRAEKEKLQSQAQLIGRIVDQAREMKEKIEETKNFVEEAQSFAKDPVGHITEKAAESVRQIPEKAAESIKDKAIREVSGRIGIPDNAYQNEDYAKNVNMAGELNKTENPFIRGVQDTSLSLTHDQHQRALGELDKVAQDIRDFKIEPDRSRHDPFALLPRTPSNPFRSDAEAGGNADSEPSNAQGRNPFAEAMLTKGSEDPFAQVSNQTSEDSQDPFAKVSSSTHEVPQDPFAQVTKQYERQGRESAILQTSQSQRIPMTTSPEGITQSPTTTYRRSTDSSTACLRPEDRGEIRSLRYMWLKNQCGKRLLRIVAIKTPGYVYVDSQDINDGYMFNPGPGDTVYYLACSPDQTECLDATRRWGHALCSMDRARCLVSFGANPETRREEDPKAVWEQLFPNTSIATWTAPLSSNRDRGSPMGQGINEEICDNGYPASNFGGRCPPTSPLPRRGGPLPR